MKKIKKYLPTSALLNIYNALVSPHLNSDITKSRSIHQKDFPYTHKVINCINKPMYFRNVFPSQMKRANTTPLHKRKIS